MIKILVKIIIILNYNYTLIKFFCNNLRFRKKMLLYMYFEYTQRNYHNFNSNQLNINVIGCYYFTIYE